MLQTLQMHTDTVQEQYALLQQQLALLQQQYETAVEVCCRVMPCVTERLRLGSDEMCGGVLQCVAVCCTVLRYVAVCYTVV